MIQQISVFVENKPGRLAEITEAVAAAGVDIRALSIADTSDFGILRLIVDRPEEAVRTLQSSHITVSLTNVIAVGIDDHPGAFAQVTRMLNDGGVTIEYMYAFVSRCEKQAFVILRVEDPGKGSAILQQGGIRILTEEEVYKM